LRQAQRQIFCAEEKSLRLRSGRPESRQAQRQIFCAEEKSLRC